MKTTDRTARPHGAEADRSSFELHAGALRLAVRPDLGGAVAGLWHRETPILRSTEPARLAESRSAAMYPLLPYSNRLGYRHFRWKGHDYTTRANVADSPHSMHGIGWQRPWRIVASSAIELVLGLDHPGDEDWPFAFEARQYLTLAPETFSARLQLTNSGPIEQPAGLGWHPYFVKRPRSRLHIELSSRWECDATRLPTRKVAQPGIDADLAHLDFDHCFEGWRGPVRIRDERFSLQLVSELAYLVVYTPPERDYYCVEPVSHVSNAIHMAEPVAHGLVALRPGATIEAAMRLDIAVVGAPVRSGARTMDVVPQPDVRVAVATPALLGEGPMWLARDEALWYCDIAAHKLHRFVPATGELRDWTFASDVASAAPCADGSFVVALRDGIWRFDPATDQRWQLAAAPYDTTSQRFNDGKCDPSGRFWVGSMDEPRRPAHAALYCFERGRLAERHDGITISNGLAWSPDGATMYWTDTTAHVVWAYDFDTATGAMAARRVFARFPSKPADGPLEGYGGRPDGAAVDADGCYWVAMYEGGRVLRFSPAGELLREVRVPALCPTMPCFGGPDLKTVYVTSASLHRPAEELARLPHSGCVFSFGVDVPGLPITFADLSSAA